MLDKLSNFFLGSNQNAVNGITPVQDSNFLVKLGLGLQGDDAVRNYQSNYNLSRLGSQLASGNIDQDQYLKSIAQYDPKLYGELALAKLRHDAPAVLQVNDAITKALKAGDIETANRIAWLQRSQAYGVNTFGPNQNPAFGPSPAQPVTNTPALPPSAAPQPDTFKVAAEDAPTNPLNPIAEQIARNAAAKKEAETRAERNVVKETAADIKEQEGIGEAEGKVEGQKVSKAIQADSNLTLIDEAKKLLPNASSGIAQLGGRVAANAIGIGTEAGKADRRLSVIAAALVSNVPRMEGPQSDKDVALYRQAAGDVANALIPIDERQAALQTIEDLQKKYKEAVTNKKPRSDSSKATGLPDGTVTNKDGTFTLPDGRIIRKKK